MDDNPITNTSEGAGTQTSVRGKHDHVNIQEDYPYTLFADTPVGEAENRAIERRREAIKNKKGRDRTGARFTGVALSGGGIRSAAFNLGAVQALQAYLRIESIDYLSTVSGGGYIGCCLTAALAGTKDEQNKKSEDKKLPEFPFIDRNKNLYNDTAAVQHIRDHSNYLKPRGPLDLVSSIYVIVRGVVVHALIIAPVLFLLAFVTLLNHPSVDSLSQPGFLSAWLWNHLLLVLGPLKVLLGPVEDFTSKVHGFWNTGIFLAVNVVFLIFWAAIRTLQELTGNFWQKPKFKYGLFDRLFAPASKRLFLLTVLAFAFDIHVFILKWEAASPKAPAEYGAYAHSLSALSFSNFLSVLALIGAILAFFSKYLAEVATRAARSPFWTDWFKKIAASTGLWFVGLVIPVFLWGFSLWLSLIGLTAGGDTSFHPFAPHWVDFSWPPNILPSYLSAAAWFYLCAAILTALSTYLFDLNATSLHSLYEKRLSDAFLFDPDPRHRDEKRHGLKSIHPKLHKIDTDLCPYPIINASLNIQGSRYANQRGRDADFFIFTPEYTGSFFTGYVGSRHITDSSMFDLGSAMAISGASVSPNMGPATIRPLTFSLAFLNIRLGYWLRNPKRRDCLSNFRATRPLCILYDEMFRRINEETPSIYLTDGGHLENLGIYELLRRRCKLIIAIDAEQDATFSFPSFLSLERYARIDLGATIHLGWEAIAENCRRFEKAFKNSKSAERVEAEASAVPCSPGPHCAAGEIRYDANETGVLLYFKAAVSGDEDDYILDYKRRHPAFPHETTGDQFFGEEQFEVYRALGFHVVKEFFTQEHPFAVKPRQGETEDEARGRIRQLIDEALGWRLPRTRSRRVWNMRFLRLRL